MLHLSRPCLGYCRAKRAPLAKPRRYNSQFEQPFELAVSRGHWAEKHPECARAEDAAAKKSPLGHFSRRAIRHALLWVPVIACMTVIFYLSSESDPLPELTAAVWDKALHFAEYAGLAVLLGRAFLGEGMSSLRAFLAAVVAASLYAASDEMHQIWVQGRQPAVSDWLAGSIGAMAGAALHLATVRFGGRW